MADYHGAAEEVIKKMFPQAAILGTGGLFTGGDDSDGMITGYTVTLDMAGQGQEVRVYEVIFNNDGTGMALLVANGPRIGEGEENVFNFNLIEGEVKVVQR